MISARAVLAIAVGLAASLGGPLSAKDEKPPLDLFDFWVGDWDATWKKPDGSIGTARNRVTKILDGTAIEEQFEGVGTEKMPALKGRSLSVWEKKSSTWKQTWVDNQGGFLSFTGKADGDKRIFITDFTSKDGKELAQRMVFRAIEKDSFSWDWESTSDGGKTWKLQWQIEYKRRTAKK